MTQTTRKIADGVDDMVERGAHATRDVVEKSTARAGALAAQTQRAADNAEKTIQAGLQQLGEAVPATLSRAATQAEALARTGIEKARSAGDTVRQRAQRAGESTVSYVREEPAKALLMAIVAGAAFAIVIGWATRSRHERRH